MMRDIEQYISFGQHQSGIETTLMNMNCTLESLLDDESFASELRKENPKLIA